MIPIQPKVREENAIILDFLPNGYPFDDGMMKTPIAQALGKEFLNLLELIPKKGIFLQPQQEAYIGEGKRDDIHHIKGRIPMEKLTTTAKNELKHAIEKIVEAQQERFIAFFNKAQP